MKEFYGALCLLSFLFIFFTVDWMEVGYVSLLAGFVMILICFAVFFYAGYKLDMFIYSGQVIEEATDEDKI